MRFEYWKTMMPDDKDKTYFWHLQSDNGEIVASGGWLDSEESCLRSIELVNGKNNFPVKRVDNPGMSL